LADFRLFAPPRLSHGLVGFVGLALEPFNAVWLVVLSDRRELMPSSTAKPQQVIETTPESRTISSETPPDETAEATTSEHATAVESTNSSDEPNLVVAEQPGEVEAEASAKSTPKKAAAKPSNDAEPVVTEEPGDNADAAAPETAAQSKRDVSPSDHATEESTLAATSSETAFHGLISTTDQPQYETGSSEVTSDPVPEPEAIAPTKSADSGTNDLQNLSETRPSLHEGTSGEHEEAPNVVSQEPTAAFAAAATPQKAARGPKRRKGRRKGSQNVVDILSPSARPIMTPKAHASSPEADIGLPRAGTVQDQPDSLGFLEQAGLSVTVSKTPSGVSAPAKPETPTSDSSATPEVAVVTVVQAPAATQESADDKKKGIYSILMEQQERSRREAMEKAHKAERVAREQTLEHKVGLAKERVLRQTKSSQAVAGSLVSALTAKSKSALSEIVQDIAQDFAAEFTDDGRGASSLDMGDVGASLEKSPSPAVVAQPAAGRTDELELAPDAALRVLVDRTKWIHEVCSCYEQDIAAPESVVEAVTLGQEYGKGILSHWVDLAEYAFRTNGVAVDESSPIPGPSTAEVSTAVGTISSAMRDSITIFAECSTLLLVQSIRSGVTSPDGTFPELSVFIAFFERWAEWLRTEQLVRRLLVTMFPVEQLHDLMLDPSRSASLTALCSALLRPLISSAVKLVLSRYLLVSCFGCSMLLTPLQGILRSPRPWTWRRMTRMEILWCTKVKRLSRVPVWNGC
jgi:hypothetical protein